MNSFVSLLVGIIVTILVSNHYFRRSTRKSLTPFIQFSSSVFQGIDSAVKDSLNIEYNQVKINDLFEIQFLIANTGERAIRDIITPLALHVPKASRILDASILYIQPKGREVFISVEGSDVVFEFPLLNPEDFFIAKILLEGEPKDKDFSFSISVDDLPPTIYPRLLPPELIDTGKKRKFDSFNLFIGFALIILGLSLAELTYAQWPTISESWKIGFWVTFKNKWPILISAVFASLFLLPLFTLCFMTIISSYFPRISIFISYPKMKKISMPSYYIRRPFRFFSDNEYFEIDDDIIMAPDNTKSSV